MGLPCKGMLFFQGESEGGLKAYADKYAKEMILLIQDERERWGQDFPLYYVQLSNYLIAGSQYFPYHDIVRIQQFKALALLFLVWEGKLLFTVGYWSDAFIS